MTSYADLDRVIAAWVKRTDSTLFTEWAGNPARFFHLPGPPPFECFQVSIEPPSTDEVTVRARSIDTNDDTVWEQVWAGGADELDAMLAAAVDQIDRWKRRDDVHATTRP
jgi:hypothetical protein